MRNDLMCRIANLFTVNPEYFVCMFVHFVRGGFRTKIKCMRKGTKQVRGSAVVSDGTKISCVRKVGEPGIRKLSAYEILWIYSIFLCCIFYFISFVLLFVVGRGLSVNTCTYSTPSLFTFFCLVRIIFHSSVHALFINLLVSFFPCHWNSPLSSKSPAFAPIVGSCVQQPKHLSEVFTFRLFPCLLFSSMTV